MSHNPHRRTCKCGQGKVSQWDGKCGHCRSAKEQKLYTYRHMTGYYGENNDATDIRTRDNHRP